MVWSREVQALISLMDLIRRLVDKEAPLLSRPGDEIREETAVDRVMSRAEQWKARQKEV